MTKKNKNRQKHHNISKTLEDHDITAQKQNNVSTTLKDYEITSEVLNSYKLHLGENVASLPKEIICMIVDDYLDVRLLCSGCNQKYDDENMYKSCKNCDKHFCDMCDEYDLFEHQTWICCDKYWSISTYYCLPCKNTLCITRSCDTCNMEFLDDELVDVEESFRGSFTNGVYCHNCHEIEDL